MIIFMLMTLVACGSSTPPQQRNAELTVEYFGKKIKHEKPKWTKQSQLQEILNKPEKKYLIFGANWCEACGFLRRALREGELLHEVEFINIEEKWASDAASSYGIKSIPTMFSLDSENNIISVKIGPGEIVVHLLIHLEK